MWWNVVGYFREKKLPLERATLYRRIALGVTFLLACLYMMDELGHGYSSYLYTAGWAYAFAVFFLMRAPYEGVTFQGHLKKMVTPPCTLLAGVTLGWILR